MFTLVLFLTKHCFLPRNRHVRLLQEPAPARGGPASLFCFLPSIVTYQAAEAFACRRNQLLLAKWPFANQLLLAAIVVAYRPGRMSAGTKNYLESDEGKCPIWHERLPGGYPRWTPRKFFSGFSVRKVHKIRPLRCPIFCRSNSAQNKGVTLTLVLFLIKPCFLPRNRHVRSRPPLFLTGLDPSRP